jgi:hypothetical protein
MKPRKTLLTVAILIALVCSVSAQSGEVARYLLNGNAFDAVGTNSGTVQGATVSTDRFGAAAGAYRFLGTTSRIDFAVPPVNQATSATVCAWVLPGNFTQTGIAVYLGADNGIGSDGFGFGLNGNSTLQGFDPYIAGGFFSSGYSFTSTSQWVHVAMVRSGGDTFTFFVNGVRTPTSTLVFAAPPTDFTIGGQNGVRYFNGAVDDVRIFNRALNSNEVLQVYNSSEVCFPHAATAVATVINGFVVGANITDGGCGYTNAPQVTIVGGGGSNATATATVTNGQVSSITIVNPGCCYTNLPRIFIVGPPLAPTLEIKVSRVKITQHVSTGHNYVLESSSDLVNWNSVGTPFTADSDTVVMEVNAETAERFFRVREIP